MRHEINTTKPVATIESFRRRKVKIIYDHRRNEPYDGKCDCSYCENAREENNCKSLEMS